MLIMLCALSNMSAEHHRELSLTLARFLAEIHKWRRNISFVNFDQASMSKKSRILLDIETAALSGKPFVKACPAIRMHREEI